MTRWIFRRSVPDAVATELDFHVEMRAHELMSQGMDPVAARRVATQRFARQAHIAAECRQIAHQTERTMRRTQYFAEFLYDLRFAWRQLWKSTAFTAMVVVTLALGIGGTSVIFSLIDAVVLRRFAYAHPERTVMITEYMDMGDGEVSAGNYVDLAASTRSFEQIGAEQFASYNLATRESPERLSGAAVTASYFQVFGVRPLLGRVFRGEEDAPGADQVVVLSEALWRRNFGADPAIVGRSIQLDGHPRTVLGVMPASFDPVAAEEQLWVPVAFTAERRAMHDEHYLNVYATLKPGVTMAQAAADVRRAAKDLAVRFPLDDGGRSARIQSLPAWVIGTSAGQLLLLFGAVSLVLLIGCGNVANLLLARSAARKTEIAVRAAIGAGRGRIVRQLLAEGLLLAGIAGVVAIVAARLTLPLLVAAAPPGIPRIEQAQIGPLVIVFALVLALLSALLAGTIPALRSAGGNLQSTLRAGGRSGTPRTADRTRFVLIAGEVAFALTLLTGSMLLIRSSRYLQHLDPGFDLHGVVTARVILNGAPATDSGAQSLLTVHRLVDNLRARPGVLRASITSQAPLGPGGTSNGLVREGLSPADPRNRVQSSLRAVTADYFSTLQIPLHRGRLFGPADVRGAPRVMIVSDSLARALWPGQDPIGKRVACCEGSPADPAWKTVVGVVGNVRAHGPTQDIAPEFYLPIDQAPVAMWSWNGNMVTIALRSAGDDPGALTAALRAGVPEVDPTMPLYRIASMGDDLRASLAVQQFNTWLLTGLGLLGLVLSIIGIYGVVAYFVTLRTHEIGVRMALGATGGNVVRLMAWQGIRPIAAGLVGGVILSTWATTLLRQSLYGVSPHDPVAFVLVAAILAGAGLLATLVPALRATRVDLNRTLQG